MVHFVGAGPGAPDLITLRGAKLLGEAGQVIYAGSLVNPELLALTRPGTPCRDSASLTLEEVLALIEEGERQGLDTVRLHTGDPSLYGAVREQMDALRERNIPFDVTPGVSSFPGAAAAVPAEYTLPGVSQTVILTRMPGRTPVPPGEDLTALAAHGASMALFLSAGMAGEAARCLLAGGAYRPDTPAAIVYKATWPEERVYPCTLATLRETAERNRITKTALILVGDFLGREYRRSDLYNPAFSHGYRRGKEAGK